MISIETAKALSEAGLEPTYHDGDYVYRQYNHRGYRLHLIADWTMDEPCYKDLPAPRLDQILTEIEKRGWHYRIDSWTNPVIEMRYSCTTQKYHNETIYGEIIDRKKYYSDTPDNASAQALIGLLNQ